MATENPSVEANYSASESSPELLPIINITPGEFISPTQEITVEIEGEIDPDLMQHSVQVTDVPGGRELAAPGRLIWRPESPMAEGSYLFRIDELSAADGTILIEKEEVPFQVIETAAEVPDQAAIIHFSRLVVDDLTMRRLPLGTRPEGEYIETMKVADRSTNEVSDLAFDAQGGMLYFDALQEDLEQRWLARYGKLHPVLHDRLEELSDDEPVDVILWLRYEDVLLNKDEILEGHENEAPPQALARWAEIQELTGSFADNLRERFPERAIKPDDFNPVVFTSLPAQEIREIAETPEVHQIFLDERNVVLLLEDSLKVSQHDQTGQLITKHGNGVKVAVWEDRPDDTSDLDIASVRDPRGAADKHARFTSAIIKNKASGPKGYAPSCSLHTANPSGYDALKWALKKDCTVVNQSWTYRSMITDPNLHYMDRLLDEAVTHWPFPLIAIASGNFGAQRSHFVSAKSYNTLIVGNHNDAADAMASSSSWRNPPTRRGDRELPEICANGVTVEAAGLTAGGTSASAPAVAGAAAILQSAKSRLKRWPEGSRAILLAGCSRKPTLGSWGHSLRAGTDQRDGAGALNVDRSLRIALSGETSPGSSAANRGWDVGTLRQGEPDSRGFFPLSYKIAATKGDYVQVALAWNFSNSIHWQHILPRPLDLDLWVFDASGRRVATPSSWENSYEIANIRCHRSQTYTVRIRYHAGFLPTYFGIAWISETSSVRP